MDFNKPFTYNPASGTWSLELHKAPKGTFAQCGVKITVDPGTPSGELAPFYQSKEPSGMVGSNIEIRCFDNLSSWTSVVTFDLPTFIEKMIELMPPDKVKFETFALSKRDVEMVESRNKQVINSFWHGSPLGELEEMCIKSFIKNGFTFNLWTYDDKLKVPNGCVLKNASDILDKELIFKHKDKSYAPFSDWFRFKLLHEQGGTWVDMDMICLRPFNLVENSVCGELIDKISMGIISLEKNHPLSKIMVDAYENPSLVTYYDTDERKSIKKELSSLSIEDQRKNAPWGFLGNDILTIVHKNFNLTILDTNKYYPIPCVTAGYIYNGISSIDSISNADCVHMWGELYRTVNPDENTNSIFHYLKNLYK